MIEKKYSSAEEMLLKVHESKESYEKKYLAMPFMDKLRVLVWLRKKAYLIGQLKVKSPAKATTRYILRRSSAAAR